MPLHLAMSSLHVWNFVRLGGLEQVVLRSAEDLLRLEELDQKLWVALACPTTGLELDPKTLALIDQDGDGRIHAPDIIEVIRWSSLHLKNVGNLLKETDALPLDAIRTDTEEGQRTLASAQMILKGFGKADAESVMLAEAADAVELLAASALNGDGVITEVSAGDDEEVRQVLSEILATVGGTIDRSGMEGVDQASADAFYDACLACAGWLRDGLGPDVLTLGEGTAAAAAAVNAVRGKVDDFFARTRLAAYDARALEALNRSENDYLALAARDLSVSAEELAGFPLARVDVDRSLPLLEGVNPAWADALATLHKAAVTPVFGASITNLSAVQWSELKSRVAPYDAWYTAKAGAVVDTLGPERIEEILAARTRERVNALIEEDKALQAEFEGIHDVERLTRYCRDFRVLLNNFVNFLDFYSLEKQATFQAGTLYLDSRSTELCIQVAGPSPLAAMSKVFIAYCDCTRAGHAPMKIAACFTQGDGDYLFVGRNGLFYDRKGLNWDAKITSIVESPISVRQAFFLPYKKFVRMIEQHAAKRAEAAEARSEAGLSAVADKATDVSSQAADPGDPRKVDIGTVAAIGVAVSGAITALTLILGYVFGLAAWQYPLVLLGLIFLISGPSVFIAWLKLRQRTIGPVLEANGWAINGRVKISVPFGTRLTKQARIPAGSRHPFRSLDAAETNRRRWRILFLLTLGVLIAGAVLIRWDALQHDGAYFWEERTVAPAP